MNANFPFSLSAARSHWPASETEERMHRTRCTMLDAVYFVIMNSSNKVISFVQASVALGI